jgi:hypothetical protein
VDASGLRRCGRDEDILRDLLCFVPCASIPENDPEAAEAELLVRMQVVLPAECDRIFES